MDTLTIAASCTEGAPLGFALTWHCVVRQVIQGTPRDLTLTLTVLPASKALAAFLDEHRAPAQVELRLVEHRRDEPYPSAMIDGFVDSAKTSWRLTDYRALATEID
jgi:hypothetical protein